MHRLSLLILFSLLSMQLNAQSDTVKKSAFRARYITIDAGLKALKVRDQVVTPLTQSGTQLYSCIGYSSLDYKRIIGFNGGGAFGYLDNPNNLDATLITSYQGFGSFFYQRRVLKELSTKWRFYAGGELQLLYQQRDNNTLFNASQVYDFNSDLLISGYTEHDFTLKPLRFRLFKKNHQFGGGNYMFDFKLATSIANYDYRTPYSIISYPGRNYTENENGYNTINQRLLIMTKTELWHFLPNDNAIKLGYEWYYSSLDRGSGQLETAQHIFSFSFIFRLNKKYNEGR